MLARTTALRTIALAAVASLAGCSANAQLGNSTSRPTTPTQLAAYAGRAEYPRESRARDELRAAAIVSRDKGAIKIYNFEDQPLRDMDVWVNGSFVHRVDGIAPGTSVAVRTRDLYDAMGNPFSAQNEEVSRVEIRTMEGLYRVMGPAAE